MTNNVPSNVLLFIWDGQRGFDSNNEHAGESANRTCPSKVRRDRQEASIYFDSVFIFCLLASSWNRFRRVVETIDARKSQLDDGISTDWADEFEDSDPWKWSPCTSVGKTDAARLNKSWHHDGYENYPHDAKSRREKDINVYHTVHASIYSRRFLLLFGFLHLHKAKPQLQCVKDAWKTRLRP